MIQKGLYHNNKIIRRHFSNPTIKIKINNQAPLLSYTGLALARDLIERLEITKTIDENIITRNSYIKGRTRH